MSNRRTYSMLLDAAMRATLVALAAKVFSVIILANMQGATVELRTVFKVIPYLSVSASPLAFLEIATYSTLAMAVIAALYLVPCVIRSGFAPQRTWGRALGVVITAETLILQILIHYVGWSNIRVDRAWWVIMALLAGVLLAAAGLSFNLRSPLADPQRSAHSDNADRRSSSELAPAA